MNQKNRIIDAYGHEPVYYKIEFAFEGGPINRYTSALELL